MLIRLSAVLSLSLTLASLASAATVINAPIDELAKNSQVILHGVVQHVDDHLADTRDGPFLTAIDLEIIEGIKGVDTTKEETFRLVLPGGRAFDRIMRIPGMPRFSVGEEVVLLLEKHSRGYALAGLGLGVFKIERRGNLAIARRDLRGMHLVDAKRPSTGRLGSSPTLESLLDTLRAHGGVR